MVPAAQPSFFCAFERIHVTEFIVDGFNRTMTTGAIFLDVTKAFDKVWKDMLLYKLLKQKFPLHLVKTIDSYLQERSYQVYTNNKPSKPHPIRAGVPQDSLIGPTLYSLYTSDIPKNSHTPIAIYADDTAILTRTKVPTAITSRLQSHINDISDWADRWKIVLNPEKTEAIFFTNHPIRKAPDKSILLNNTPIPYKKQIKYLGLTLDSKLKFTPQLTTARKRADRINNFLYPLLNKNSPLSTSNKILLYQSIVRPILTYACPVWHNTLTTTSSQLI